MINKSPKNIDNFKRRVQFTNCARQGWELILMTLDASSKILLPSYIGITEREGSRIGVVLFGEIQVFHRPHPSPDTDKGAVSSIRKWLEKNGVKP